MAAVMANISMPDEDAEELLQLLRAWEQKAPQHRHMRLAFTGNMKAEEVTAMVKRLAPTLDVIVIPLKRNQG